MDNIQARRTRVVNLGLMAREEIIEIAKKQARSIGEKSARINALEKLVLDITGSPVQESLLSHDSTESMRWASENRNELVLEQAMESERVAYVTELSKSEEVISGLNHQLEEKTQDYALLQSQVESWKEKVMVTSLKYQEIITYLQQRLQGGDTQGQLPPPTEPQRELPALPTPFINADVQQNMDTWKEDMKAKTQRDEDRIKALEAEVFSLQQKLNSSQSAAFPTVASSEDALGSSTCGITEQIPNHIIQKAVEERVKTWKTKVQEIIQTDRNTIQHLQEQLHALRAAPQENTISHASPFAVVHEISSAEKKELGTFKSPPTTAVAQHQISVQATDKSLSNYHAQLESTQGERESAVASAEAKERAAESAQVESVVLLEQEIADLRAQLESAQRERESAVASAEAKEHPIREDVFAEISGCIECAKKNERMDSWKKKVKVLLERADEDKLQLLAEVTSLQEHFSGAEAGYCESIELLRSSMAKLQMEVCALVEERRKLVGTIEELSSFKELVMSKLSSVAY